MLVSRQAFAFHTRRGLLKHQDHQYDQSVQSAQLQVDLGNLPAGDQTEIGAKLVLQDLVVGVVGPLRWLGTYLYRLFFCILSSSRHRWLRVLDAGTVSLSVSAQNSFWDAGQHCPNLSLAQLNYGSIWARSVPAVCGTDQLSLSPARKGINISGGQKAARAQRLWTDTKSINCNNTGPLLAKN